VAAKGIRTYLTAIVNGRGMAKSNNYVVYFSLTAPVKRHLTARGRANGLENRSETVSPSKVGERIMIMCDEVSLPGLSLGTGSIAGRHLGQGPVYYPTSPIYNDMQLSFMCDAEMQAFKMLLDWNEFIYSASTPVGLANGERARKLRYPEEYQCRIIIEKTERNKNSEIGAKAMKFTLNNAWPYSVDAVNLSYGSSQLVKCTANFYYSSWERDMDLENRGLGVFDRV